MSSNSGLKILMLSLEHSPELSGGIGTHTEELSSALSRSGDFVTVLACTVGKAGRWTEGNKSVHLLPPDGVGGLGADRSSIAQGILAYNVKMASYAKTAIFVDGYVPDLVQCHNWITFPAAQECARLLGIPIVCTIHYLCEPIDRFWGHNPDPEIVVQEKALFQGVNSLITVSESMRAIAQDTHGVPDWQISVIHNGIDVESFLGTGVSSEDLSRLKSAIAPHNEKIVLYAGRLHPHKGMKELLDSASLVVRREPNARYVVAGDPDSPFYARQFQQKLDSDPLLKTKMLVLGKLTRRRLAALYSIANVSVVPSLYDPFPYAAIESMAAGVPVVAGDCGGLAEAIVHGQSGLLVPVRVTEGGVHCMDVQSLAASVSMLLNQEDMARELARTARARVQEKFTLDQMTHSTREIYRRTLARFCKTAA